ncbi:MAG: putative sulfate exporter family transporter [Planctomycetota bacterium]
MPNPYQSESHDSPENLSSEPNQDKRPSTLSLMKTSEDWWAIWCAGFLLMVCFVAVWWTASGRPGGETETAITSPLKPYLGKPAVWSESPLEAFYQPARVLEEEESASEVSPEPNSTEGSAPVESDAAEPELIPAKTPFIGVIGAFVLLGGLFTVAMKLRGENASGFLKAFPVLFLLGVLSYVLAGQSVIKSYNLEYALWALLVGLIVSNVFSVPDWLRPVVQTEFFIKTGLVLLGAEVLLSRLLALGIPGIGVAWVVTPIVLVSTYVFGQRVLKLPSRSLNMVISADMSVCGVSAAIATAAACKAKKEELSLAIGLSLSFTVVMMVLLPMVITILGLPTAVGGAWLGGTIDATGAVAVAGATLGKEALEVAATVKMIQNVLIGVTAFCVAVYWTSVVEAGKGKQSVGLGEVWYRFPKFVLGFVAASLVFSFLHGVLADGDVMVEAMYKGSTKTLRGWLFCLAFVSIGLDTRFRELLPYFRGGKPMLLYVCGQSLNLLLTFLMAYLMFGVLFPSGATP